MVYSSCNVNIVIYSHFFKIIEPPNGLLPRIYEFCNRYVLAQLVFKKGRKPYYVYDKVFAARTKFSTEFRFHIGQLKEFISFLKECGLVDSNIHIRNQELYKPESIKVKLKVNFDIRDYQKESIDFITDSSIGDHNSRLLALPTGTGKTFCFLNAVTKLQNRCMLVLLPTYIDKWCSDITSILNVKPSEIMVIQGSKKLKGLIQLAKDGKFKSKFIVVSLITLRLFFKAYENNPKEVIEEYGCRPEDLCKLLKIGTLGIDEVHQHIHSVFSVLLYTHVPKFIALSATLVTKNTIIEKIHSCMFPKELRYEKVKMDKYIKLYSVSYQFKDIFNDRIRTSEYGKITYSHIAFERSVLKNKRTSHTYMLLIEESMKFGYIQEYIDKDKMIIFTSTGKMCEAIVSFIKSKYPKFDTRKYMQEDPYENILEADIIVSTMQSAGTALDIPNLRCVIQTISVDSPVSNLQSLGRLRNLKDRDVKFVYIYCTQLNKQKEFHFKRKQLFEDRVASIKEFSSNIIV